MVIVPKNHTLVALWKETPSNYVEIVFETKDLTEDRAKEIIKQFTEGEGFEIVKFDSDLDGTRVIIKFADEKAAVGFVEDIRASSTGGTKVKQVKFSFEKDESSSMFVRPILVVHLLL